MKTDLVEKHDSTQTVVDPGNGSTALLEMINRAAKDPTVDIDKMERLFEMHQRIESRRAEQDYNSAMAAAQAEMAPVAKNKTNNQTHSKYADLATLSEQITPIYTKHGFGISFSTKAAPDGCVGIVAEVTHAGGFCKRYEYDIPADGVGMRGNANKTATHAYGSSLTYGRRYAKLLIFDIATKDDDGNGAGRRTQIEFISDEQVEELRALLKDTGSDETAFLKFGGADSLDTITTSNFPKAKGLLLQKKSRMGGAQ